MDKELKFSIVVDSSKAADNLSKVADDVDKLSGKIGKAGEKTAPGLRIWSPASGDTRILLASTPTGWLQALKKPVSGQSATGTLLAIQK